MFRGIFEAGICHCRRTAIQDGRFLGSLVWSAGFSTARSTRRPADNKRGKGGDASIRQRRLASEVKAVVFTALQQGPCNAPLLQRCGFEIQEVKMSSDLRKAFVLWKAMPGMHQTVEKELKAQVKRLRSMVFEHLNMPFSPSIEFRQDLPSLHAQAVDEALAKLDEESD